MTRVIRNAYVNDVEEICSLYETIPSLKMANPLNEAQVRNRIIDSEEHNDWFFTKLIEEEGIVGLVSAHKEITMQGKVVCWVDGVLSKNNFLANILLTELFSWCNMNEIDKIYAYSEFDERYNNILERKNFNKEGILYSHG